jgi:formiminotetrahydrofolate cyclodeaminase
MTIGTKTIHQLLCELSSKSPTPGGGAVAGVLSGLSAALGSMVLAYSEGKESISEYSELHTDCIKFFNVAKDEAIALGDADAVAYERVSSLWKLSKDDPKRIEQWDDALIEAIQIPLRTMELSERILITLKTLVGKSNSMLSSDLAIAAILAESSARAGYWNVAINIAQMEDGEQKSVFELESATLLSTCKEYSQFIEQSCKV